MPDLIAQYGKNENNSVRSINARWRKVLPEIGAGRFVMLGRKPDAAPDLAPILAASSRKLEMGHGGDETPSTPTPFTPRHLCPIPWAVPWDRSVSRHHAILFPLSGDRMEVVRDPRSRNPLYYRGQPRERFVLVPGEHFVVGETTFTLARRPGFTGPDRAVGETGVVAASTSGEVTEMAFAQSMLEKRDFRDSHARIELLARLPDLVTGSVSDEELYARVSDVVMKATPEASAVVVLQCEDDAMHVLHYDSRDAGQPMGDVSSRLVKATLSQLESVLHLWDHNTHASSGPEFTAVEEIDWAFCVPLRSEACRGLAIYVTGSRANVSNANGPAGNSQGFAERLGDDVKFAEVVGSLVSGIRQTNQYQQRHAAMRRFFAPVVLEAIAGTDSENWLQPRQCDLSVMFCDLRGFTRTSQQHADQLLFLLQQVSDALGVMTKHILDTEGVIGDFHGDAAMGFWGWPLPLPHGVDPCQTAALAATRAAQAIRRDYAAGETQFRCGIGIASGAAVAGRIGTVDQVKVTAFGPVVNLASRLEGLTKKFGVEILVDEATADLLKASDEDQAGLLRYLGKVRLDGIDEPLVVHEVIIETDDQTHLNADQLKQSRAAWDAFELGCWDEAYQQLHELPAWDRPKDVLLRLILQHHRVAPPDWDGVMDFPK